jgi:hypothetical protein
VTATFTEFDSCLCPRFKLTHYRGQGVSELFIKLHFKMEF